MNLELRALSLRLPAFTLELNASIHSPATAVFGPSGSGKTTLLDLIAGLRRPDTGAVVLDGQTLADAETRTWVPARHRRIGYVPQDLALFPHLSVRGNVLYGGHPRANESGTTPGFDPDHILEVLEIGSLMRRRVDRLSGGEQQRVALARALVCAPRMLLLDEPLASLDRRLKRQILPYLRKVHVEFKVPIIHVTHDEDEVRALCDEVLIIERGNCVRQVAVREGWSAEDPESAS